jgi:DNA-binding LacI/PurR family transcriptional regulator
MVTMADVARIAGVSTMTVSNVLNDRKAVSDSVRERVIEAVEASGYVMNHSARALRKGSTGVIGLAVPGLDNPYFTLLAQLVIARAAELGYRVAVEQTSAKVEGELAAVATSRTLDYDGLIMTAVEIDPEQARRLGRTIPLVLIGEKSLGGTVDHVAMANVEGTRAATAHLAERGCRRIAWVSLPGPVDDTNNVLYLRRQGYLQALEQAGLQPDSSLMVSPGDGLTLAGGRAAAHRLVDHAVNAEGVVAVTDSVALGVLRGLADRGVRVPADVRVVGFDDVNEAEFSVPSLSSVHPGHDWMVDTMLNLLLERISGTRTGAGRELVAPYELIVRESSA